MKLNKGYYCIVQYCPDLSRLEAANIGVLLFCPELRYLQAKTSRDNARIRHFFGSEGHDWTKINSFKEGFEERLQFESKSIRSLEELEKFIATRGNEFQITPPRPMKVFNPNAEIDELFQELVGGAQHAERRTTFKRYLEKKFSTAGIDRKLKKDIPVTVPIFNREVEIPFAFKNGRLNLLQPVRFESRELSHSLNTACRYAVEGRSLFESPHPRFGEMKLIVLGKFRAKDEDTQENIRRILTEHEVELFSLPELPTLIDEIRTNAKDLDEPSA